MNPGHLRGQLARARVPEPEGSIIVPRANDRRVNGGAHGVHAAVAHDSACTITFCEVPELDCAILPPAGRAPGVVPEEGHGGHLVPVPRKGVGHTPRLDLPKAQRLVHASRQHMPLAWAERHVKDRGSVSAEGADEGAAGRLPEFHRLIHAAARQARAHTIEIQRMRSTLVPNECVPHPARCRHPVVPVVPQRLQARHDPSLRPAGRRFTQLCLNVGLGGLGGADNVLVYRVSLIQLLRLAHFVLHPPRDELRVLRLQLGRLLLR
mmetsp:Transcript_56684/g.179141  ORF Transcript_56684/g.179141 Transcript_56684/m.179141 type:complete len:265 (+) Transcript_56684:510-1304(+)